MGKIEREQLGSVIKAELDSFGTSLSEKVNKSQIINNLLSTTTGDVLDALQGKVLQDGITAVNSALFNKIPISASVTTDILTLDQGQYVIEGAVSTTYNYPYTLSFDHATILVLGIGSGGSNGYRIIVVMPYTGTKLYMNFQSWSTWSGWKSIALT